MKVVLNNPEYNDVVTVPVDKVKEMNTQLTQLRAEVERLRKDAERYRWLRENLYVEDGCLEMAKNIYCPSALNKADIDAAIDAAKEEKQ